MKLTSSDLPALLDDLDAAVSEMRTALAGDPASWTRAPEGKWSAGQHAEHVAISMDEMIERFEKSADELRAGTLGTPPKRGLLQAFVMRMLMREPFPSGAKAQAFSVPGPTPARETVFQRLTSAAERYRAVFHRMTLEERERVWIINPFQEARRWHYRLFESVRVQTTHARHHLRLARKAAVG